MQYPLKSNTKQVNYQYTIHAHNHILIALIDWEGKGVLCCAAFLPFLRKKLNSLAWQPSLGTPAIMDNWPIPLFRVHAKNSPSCCTLNGPSDSITVIGSRLGRHLTANHIEGQEACLTYPPPFHHCWDQLSAQGLSSRGWFHVDRLVIEVKMSSGYQSGSITAFKACKSTYTTQRRPNPLKTEAEFILQVWEMDVFPLHVLAQQIKTEIHEPQTHSFSAAFLQLCGGKIQREQGLESITF